MHRMHVHNPSPPCASPPPAMCIPPPPMRKDEAVGNKKKMQSFDSWAHRAVDPHCLDADPDPDPAQNLDADPDPDPDPDGGGVGQPVHPPWQNPRYAPVYWPWAFQWKHSWANLIWPVGPFKTLFYLGWGPGRRVRSAPPPPLLPLRRMGTQAGLQYLSCRQQTHGVSAYSSVRGHRGRCISEHKEKI